jgi:hypothetical protein
MENSLGEELNRLQMVVLAVGLEDRTEFESYFLFYDSTVYARWREKR